MTLEPLHGLPQTHAGPPSPWVSRFLPLIPSGGPVLDLACGAGRHLRALLGRGCPLTGVDRDLRGVADLLGTPGLRLVTADLEDGSPWPLPGEQFAAIIVTHYLWRPLFPAILAALQPGGLLLYETFANGHQRFGRPSNPSYLLRDGELLTLTAGSCQIVAFEQGIVASPKAAVVQRLCAVKTPSPALDLQGDPEPQPLPAIW